MNLSDMKRIRAAFEELKVAYPEQADRVVYGAIYHDEESGEWSIYFYDAEFNIFYEGPTPYWEFTDYENLSQFAANDAEVMEM